MITIKISSNHMTQRKPKEYFSIYKCISLQNEYVSPCLLFFFKSKNLGFSLSRIFCNNFFCLQKAMLSGLKRCHPDQVHSLLLQRTRVPFPASTWQFTAICNSSSRDLKLRHGVYKPLFFPVLSRRSI